MQAVGWQVGAPPLDDVQLTLKDGKATSFFALSVKRGQQVTRNGFPNDFVRAVWSRWLYPGVGEGAFDKERDYFGLAVGVLSSEVRNAWDNLLRQALVGDPEELARRFTTRSISKVARDLYRSLQCPADLQSELRSAIERVRLIRRIRLLHFDFRSEPSADHRKAIEVCRKALASGNFAEARDLWERLIGIAAELQPLGGCLDLSDLLKKLRGKFRLMALPDYRDHWERLTRTSEDALDRVKESLGSRITLLRPERLREIGERLAPGRQLLLVGASGAGKSALAKITCRRWPQRPVLWFDGTAADVAGLFALEQRLQLRNSLADLLRDTPDQGLLVFDALETWSPQALDVAAGLLKLCASLSNWSVMMTIRPDHPRKLLPNLKIQAGLSNDFEPLSVPPLEAEMRRETQKALTELNPLFLRRDLEELLRNLKVLDWLATVFASDHAPEVPEWVRVSEVVDGLWDLWIGTGEDSRLRGELLKKLALREAETLRSGVGFSELDSGELRALRSLEELLISRDDNAFFQHELAGDWARLRILVERDRRGSSATDLAGFARSPRWSPAIRLFGERLLEQENVLANRWSALYDELAEGPGTNDARGVLLESLFWAGNAAEALESAWPRLVADDGELLKRLLGRFLYSATIPDPGAAEFANDERTAAEIRALVRFPYWPLWKPVLAALDSHRDDVATIAPELGAKVCELWLRTVPREWLWRTAAARVAYTIAREAQHRGAGMRRLGIERKVKRDQKIYEAALLGAPDLPAEVSDLALELSRRREEPSAIQKPIRKAPSGIRSLALMGALKWPLFPDGPRKAVNEGFQLAVLGGQALSGLIECRPEIAREVLLACCLQAPGPDLHRHSLGTMDRFVWQRRSPPMFFMGPFLQFLKRDAAHGLDAILRLVNQATANWTAVRQHEARSARGYLSRDAFHSLVPWEEMTEWEGDGEVYAWYRQHLSGSAVVTSALMALEKWLYELVDEGRDIGAALTRIFAESRSVAFAGVLVALGKKVPELFAGPLLPLLSAWPLYRWDWISIERNEIYRSDLPDFVDFGERVFEMVRSWHLLPHRRVPLSDSARELLLKNPSVAIAFESFREHWREQLRSETVETPRDLERLIALFDPANYPSLEMTSFEWPEHLQPKSEGELSAVAHDIEAASFTEWCLGVLQERRPLTPEESRQLWDALGDFDRLAQEREELSRWAEAVAAGIAVLLDLSRDWIAAEPARLAWCRERLEAILDCPPAPDILDDGSSPPDLWHLASFMTISGVLLLALDGNDLLARHIVAEQIVGRRGIKLALTLRSGFRERRRLGEDWGRMQSLAVLGAALRFVGYSAADPTGDPLRSWASRLARRFVQRKIRPGPHWERISLAALRLRERLYSKEYETRTDEFAPQRFPPVRGIDPGFDLSTLEAAFAWLPRLEEACDENERHEWIHLHRELLGVAERMRQGLERLEPGATIESWGSGLLSEYERWLSPYLARLIPQLGDCWREAGVLGASFSVLRGASVSVLQPRGDSHECVVLRGSPGCGHA